MSASNQASSPSSSSSSSRQAATSNTSEYWNPILLGAATEVILNTMTEDGKGSRRRSYYEPVTYGAYPLFVGGRHYGEHLMWCELYEVGRIGGLALYKLGRQGLIWTVKQWRQYDCSAKLSEWYKVSGAQTLADLPSEKWKEYDCGAKIKKALSVPGKKWKALKQKYISGLRLRSPIVYDEVGQQPTPEIVDVSETPKQNNKSMMGGWTREGDDEWEDI